MDFAELVLVFLVSTATGVKSHKVSYDLPDKLTCLAHAEKIIAAVPDNATLQMFQCVVKPRTL